MVASMMVLGFMVKIGCRLPVSEIAKTLNTFHPSVINDSLISEGMEDASKKINDCEMSGVAKFDYLVAFLLLVLSGNAYEQFQTLETERRQGIEDSMHLGELKTKEAQQRRYSVTNKQSYHEFLEGQVHKGFYDTLLRPLNTATASYGNMMSGPPNPLKIIMEAIFIRAIKMRENRQGLKPINLWITGHSLGGALASLAMARLQRIVKEGDPLLLGWDSDRQAGPGVGRTVLEIMVAQFYKAYPSYDACLQCTVCDHTKWKGCKDCHQCKRLKMEKREKSLEDCGPCKQLRKEMRDRAGEGYLSGCQKCEVGDERCRCGLRRCDDCYQYCGECGDCNYCNIGKDCEECKRLKEPNLVVLRDCYTFGSPRIGDTVFAEAFAANQNAIHGDLHYGHKSTHWRVATENDIVTKLPLGGYEYNPKPQEPGHRSSLLDYQHVGYLVKLHNKIRQPVVSKSTFEAELVPKVLISEDELQGREKRTMRETPTSRMPSKSDEALLAEALRSFKP
ncbi:hypothetical protein BGZ72_008072, partial [Mortierella alpina]